MGETVLSCNGVHDYVLPRGKFTHRPRLMNRFGQSKRLLPDWAQSCFAFTSLHGTVLTQSYFFIWVSFSNRKEGLFPKFDPHDFIIASCIFLWLNPQDLENFGDFPAPGAAKLQHCSMCGQSNPAEVGTVPVN